MRSLPIANAFRSPFASSCRGSSTLGFVRRVTESDCLKPLNVGVRQELVRVSVRAVDIGRLRIWAWGQHCQVLRWPEELSGVVHAFGWLSIEPDVCALPGPAVGSWSRPRSAFDIEVELVSVLSHPASSQHSA